ncbi:MAG: SH3 domain-containing protein [Oscillochloris sp.]|nr:SH3 domain-containing protein [Oscillochloris sp.]
MFGFGNKKKEEEAKEKAEQEKIAQDMKTMSDQIAKQAQVIKQLEEQLTAAKGNAAVSSGTTEALSAAQKQIKQLNDEMAKIKAKAAAAPATGKTSSAGGATASTSSATGAVGAILGGVTTDKAAPTPVVTPAPVGGLAAGGTAYVQRAGGKNLRLRNAAGLESNVIDGLPPGTQMSLIAGPVEKDGYPWWHIRTSDGREGWVAGTELVTHPE